MVDYIRPIESKRPTVLVQYADMPMMFGVVPATVRSSFFLPRGKPLYVQVPVPPPWTMIRAGGTVPVLVREGESPVHCPLTFRWLSHSCILHSAFCSIGKLRHAEHKYPVYIIVPLVRPPQPRKHELCACVRWGCARKLLDVRRLRSSELVRDRWLADRSCQISKRPYNTLITLASIALAGVGLL